MIFPAFPRRRKDSIAALYGAIVAQARSPAFYRAYRVPDTREGRFELVVLHTALVIRRLGETDAGRKLGQALFDRFCTDMDQNLREMGVGDLAVPRQMQKVGEAYYGRAAAYDSGLASGRRDHLVAALAKNIFSTTVDPPSGARHLAAYVAEAAAILAAQDLERLQQPPSIFPDPESALTRANE
jgi:cytochrome b pre-mRNA-processing protein 3